MSLYGSVIWVPSDRTGVTNMAAELETNGAGTAMVDKSAGETTIDNETNISAVSLGA